MTSLLVVDDNMMRDETTSTAHLTSDRLAAFLDGRLVGADRERTVSHFAECAECRNELTELRAMVNTPRPAWRRAWIAGAVALAAVLSFVVVPRVTGDMTGRDAVSTVRAGAGVQIIDIHSPLDSAVVERSELKLAWQSAGPGARYRVTVQDNAGNSIWAAELDDTTSVVPETARLERGTRYFWSVDARLADGSSARTGARQFTIR